MNFQVLLLPEAERDFDEILTWINRQSPEGALSWRRAWVKTIRELEQSADHCSVAPESSLYPQHIRHRVFRTRRGKPYRILLTIRGDIAYILHVRGPGQDIVDPDAIRIPPPLND
jgi:plasmid stabilization system protein ParE